MNDMEVQLERMRKAVKVFRTMQPMLTAYARAVTGNRKVRVVLSSQGASTDGTNIYFRPPLALGEDTVHDRRACDKRDPDTYLQLCKACAVREEVHVNIYHEIGHIAFESFTDVSEHDKAYALTKAAEEMGGKYAEALKRHLAKGVDNSYLAMANLINPYLRGLFNAVDDARVDGKMFEARRGIRVMLQASTLQIFREGTNFLDGQQLAEDVSTWMDAPLNSQAAIACIMRIDRYRGWEPFLNPDVVRHTGMPNVQAVLDQLAEAKTVDQTFRLALPLMEELRQYGYFQKPEEIPDDQPPPPSSESGNDDSSDDDEQDGSPEDQDADDSEESGSQESGDGDEGAEDGASSDATRDDDADDASDSPPSGDSDEDEAGSSSSSDGDQESQDEGTSSDQDADAEGSDEVDDVSDSEQSDGDGGEPDSDPGTDSSEGDDGSGGDQQADDADSQAGGDGGSDSDSDPSASGDGGEPGSETTDTDDDVAGDEGESDAEGSSESGGTPSEDSGPDGGEGGAAGPDGEAEPDESGGDQSSDSSDGTDSDDGDGDSTDGDQGEHGESDGDAEAGDQDDASGSELPEDDRPDEGGLPDDEEVRGDAHESAPPAPDHKHGTDGQPCECGYCTTFGTPEDLNDLVHKLHDLVAQIQPDVPTDMDPFELEDTDRDYTKYIDQSQHMDKPSEHIEKVNVYKQDDPAGAHFFRSEPVDEVVPESVVGGALLHARKAFADNGRAAQEVNLKRGRVRSSTLGRRAWQNDPRLFEKSTQPGRKDYSVLVGIDLSTSSIGAEHELIRKCAMAQCAIMHRLGVRFAVYGHSGNKYQMKDWAGDVVSSTMAMDLVVIKEFDEPWSEVVQNRMKSVRPHGANLDGHTLEFYRKRLDEEATTDRILMYYTDGLMPWANKEEELEVLEREIKTCQRKGYTLMGVEIGEGAECPPELDTVKVLEETDVKKVVKHLEKRLANG